MGKNDMIRHAWGVPGRVQALGSALVEFGVAGRLGVLSLEAIGDLWVESPCN